MRVGIGLPNGVPGADGALLLEWARRADQGPFSSLGVVERVVYDSYDPLIALAAAAAVTRRVRLASTIVIGPLYNTTQLAKMAASIDALSGGRLVLGLAVGARKEDYEAVGVEYKNRGKRLNEQLFTLRTIWEQRSERAIGPAASRDGGPDVLIGGLSDLGFARMTRYADGYVHGGGPPRAFARAADKARAAWSDAGRQGRPQLWAQGYFALAPEGQADEATEVRKQGADYLRDYYSFTGPFAEKIAAGLLTTPQAIAQFLRGYEDAGCDEMILFPTIPHIAQLDLLASAINGLERSS